MAPGVYNDLSNAAYHGGAGVSKSGLDLISQSPMHYRAAMDAEHDRQPTPAQMIGTAFHAMLLEPQEFTKTYCLSLRRSDVPNAIDDREILVAKIQEINAGRLAKLPTSGSKDDVIARILQDQDERPTGADGHTAEALAAMKATELKAIIEAANKERIGHLVVGQSNRHELAAMLRQQGVDVTLWSDVLAEWHTNNSQRIVLSQDNWDLLHAMRDAVEAHPAARALLAAPGVSEQSVYWNDPVTGELCRCRPDYWRDDGILVDVKTTEDASPEGFAKSLANWRYHVQAPFYTDGINTMREQANRPDLKPIKAFVFLAVEKKFPHAVGVYIMDAESTDLGRAEYQRDLAIYAECKRTGKWPAYGEKIATISLPKWTLAQGAELLAQAA